VSIVEQTIPSPGTGGLRGIRESRPHRGFWAQAWKSFRTNRVGLVSGALLLTFIVIALLAPVIGQFVTHYSSTAQDLNHPFAAPSHQHLLGSDELGRDTLTRLVYGARASLGIGFLTVVIALTIGVAVGLTASYFGGLIDDLLMRAVDVVLATPAIFLYILMAILFRPSPIVFPFIIASVSWAPLARLVRAEGLSLRHREFMLATESLGAGHARLILRHLLPNTIPVVIVAASLRLGQVILIEAALDYLGLGVQPPTPTWGNMLSNAEIYFSYSVWLVVLPGVAIFLTVIATNLLGNALRDAFDPWQRKR
jgi:peptide/nickel transport system permease protein